MADKVKSIFMLEVLGKPPEHIQDKLKEMVDKLSEEVEVTDKNIAEPKKIKDEEGIFTTFAEVEFETNLQKLLGLVFGYMPSNIEIVSPEKMKITNSDINSLLNQLTQRLHQYDEFAKGLMLERKRLAKQIKNGEIRVENVVKTDSKEEKETKDSGEDKSGEGKKEKE